MLLFADSYVLAHDMAAFPSSALTFECWVKTADSCGHGTIMSYAVSVRADSKHDFFPLRAGHSLLQASCAAPERVGRLGGWKNLDASFSARTL